MFKQVLACLFAVAVASSSTSTISVVNAEAQQGTAAVVSGGISIATALIPIIGDLFKNNQKECRQVACWISTTSCYKDAAAQVQNQVFQGRDGYTFESVKSNGAWVRYWRTRTGVSKDQIVASGKCSDGKRFEVSDCQMAGKVHC